MSRLGLLLYSKRKELKLTQRELSERIGVCQGCISNYERGVLWKLSPEQGLFFFDI